MNHYLRIGVLALLACSVAAPEGFDSLLIAKGGYPRAYFFRAAERIARVDRYTWEDFDRTFSRLMGIEGKALDEELVGLQKRNIEFFTRFKQRHPEQMVVLHYNGNSRLPDHEAGEFFAGHWLYFDGSTVVSDVSAGESESEVRVEKPAMFLPKDDAALCERGADGKPNWNACEQVNVVAVNKASNTVRIARGVHGTSKRAFAGGKAYIASHITEGPRGPGGLEWFYNHASTCPRNAKGRTAGDVLVDEMTRRFGPGGQFATWDGLQFDVLWFVNRYHAELRRPRGRSMDADGDGVGDGGVINGLNVYGIGATEFTRKLRARFPAGKIINADGMDPNNQRSFGILNGMEAEGFPHLRDLAMNDWSGGLNRFLFWRQNARPPVFNYINHKYIQPGQPDVGKFRPEIPFGIHRLSFAAGVFTDSAICYAYEPPAEQGEIVGIWDELQMGAEHRVGWLGQPAGPAMHLASRQPDLLGGRGPALLSKPAANTWTLKNITKAGGDLFVTLRMTAQPLANYPPEIGRLVRVGVVGSNAEPTMTWANGKEFTSTFFFRDVPAGASLEIKVEGAEPVAISGLTAHASPDVMVREFERGIVLANPGARPYTFRLTALSPGKSYRRLRGSSKQDAATNNGAAVGREITLQGKDALFLVRQ